MMDRIRIAAVAFVVGLGADAAETHSAHEHGHGVLKLVREGTQIVVQFESPLDSIVGFEHAPETDAQRTALDEATRLVAVAENIVRLSRGCTLLGEPEVDMPHVGHDDDHDAPDEHSDTVHADHGSTGDDADDHDSDGHAEAHADLQATFTYRCESAIEWLEATAFETFDGLEEIELQAVGPDGAVVKTLTAASPRAVLTGF